MKSKLFWLVGGFAAVLAALAVAACFLSDDELYGLSDFEDFAD